MEIKNTEGKVLLTVNVDDESYRYREIMGDNSVTLKYSLAEHVELPVGCYIEFQTERYTLLRPECLKMIHTRDFEYTVTFESEQAKTGMWKFRNTVDGRLKFPLTAKPKEHLKMLVDNLNARETGWTMGDCIDGTETLISYDHLFCLDALKQMAETFNTEYEFEGKRVSLRRVEYNKDTPLDLQYGHGKGFKTGIERANSGETAPVEILFVQGGTRNIDPSKYGASELRLPKNTALAYDGTKFEDEAGYRAADARHYITDGSGLSVRRSDKALSSKAEDSLDCSSVYPSRVGKVSEVVVVDASKNFYDIVDPSIPDTLDYGECLIAGETMTVVFQSGELSGREFDVKYYHKAVSGKKAKRFEIVPAEQDGQTMPGGTFLPKAGDTYAVFHCQLPAAYINDTKTKTGAEWDMYRKAVKYMYDNEEAEFSFTGDLDGLWAKKDWENIGGRIKLGGYVRFTDERFQKTPVLVRITGIKDYINDPHSPEIDLSNKTVSGGVSTRLSELESQSVEIEETRRESIAFTQRRYRDALETMGLLEKSLLDNYTNSINPIAIQTMQLLVGDESLQFRFVSNRTNPVEVSHTFTYNKAAKQLSTGAGVIQHMTLGIDSLSSTHAASDYKYWSVSAYTSAVLDDPTKKYYLYIKASKTATTAVFRLSEAAIKMEAEAGYYNFLCGVLNSEYDGERSFATLYGFTEILPGRVTTDRLVSGNGLSFFDLLANAFKLGDRLRFNTEGRGQLILNGTLVQRGDTEQPIIMYRGQWSASVAYTVNDVVFYQDGNKPLSSYTCIKDTTAGIAPTNATYWQPFAQGVKGDSIKGDTGNMYVFLYAVSQSSAMTAPTFTTPAEVIRNAIWSFTAQKRPEGYNLFMTQSIYTPSTGKYGGWSTPIPINGDKGDMGADGSEIEFIYLTNTGSQPSTPTSENRDDFVPQGWSDNPSGVSEAKQYEWVSVRQKPAGKNTVWGAFSKPVVWSKWGEKGQDGDGLEYIFTRTEFDIAPTAPDSVSVRGNVPAGWSDDPQGVTEDYPFEWVSVRSVRGNSYGKWSEPKQWNKLNVWNPNLLDESEFESLQKLDKWSAKSEYQSGQADDYVDAIHKSHVVTGGGIDGRNYYSDVNTRRNSESNYKEMLQQVLWNADTMKLQPSTWYTLSFYERCGATSLFINQTSKDYGFATQSLYLFAGQRYNLHIGGFISQTASNKKHFLRIYIYRVNAGDDNWKWGEGGNTAGCPFVDIDTVSTRAVEKVITFGGNGDDFGVVPETAEYRLTAYLYPSDTDRASVDYGTATLSWIRLHNLTAQANVYVYPSVIETGKVYVDGRQVSGYATDMCTNIRGNEYNEGADGQKWRRHVITFQTVSDLTGSAKNVLWRIMPSPVSGQRSFLQVCQPKLERGKVATGYAPNGSDMHTQYQEMRFAVNGSTSSAPALNRSAAEPEGWSVKQPNVGKLQYLWMTVATKMSDGTLVTEWSTPVRITPYDGQDGYSPALVFCGVYDNTKTYYGTPYRVDAVKYQNTYYVARVDAGTFSGVVPSDTSKWNTFGGQFESIATNLLLAEGANIGDWFVSKGKIVSTLDNGNKIELDAKARTITIFSQQTGGQYIDKSENTTIKTTLTLDADDSVMRVENNNGVAYVSSAGIFANRAGTQCVSSTTGFTHKAAICGLGFANQNKSAWEFDKDENLVAGVYGNAFNSGTAPSYGGFFYNLRVNGLILNTKYIEKSGEYLTDSQTYIIGLSNDTCNVYLPASSRQGQTVLFKQIGTGTMRVYPRSGQKIYDDDTVNDYYDVGNGQMLTATFSIFYETVNKVTTKVEAWLVSRMKF